MNIVTLNQIKGSTGGVVQGNSSRAKLNIRDALRSSISAG